MPILPFKLNQDRRHHIPRQRHKVTNWPAYDASLRQRGSLTVWFTDEAIAAWAAEPRTTRGGQPWYSPLAILTALTLRAVFRLAYRQAEGLIGSIVGLLGLSLRVPDHTTLSRRAATLEVPRPRNAGAEAGSEPMHLLVDSTGLKLCGKGEWLLEKHGTATRRSWRALHLGVDAGTGRIVACTLTVKDVDDASQAGPLLDQVAGAVASFTADGAYDQDRVYASVAKRHPEAAVIVPPRANAVPSDTAETAPTQRDGHLQHIAEHGNAIVVPGTLRDSLVLLALLLEQETELEPMEVMTDTAAYSDAVFGLFWLLGYQFSPRLADLGDARLWRIDRKADYGPFNGLGKGTINPGLIRDNWSDAIRLAGSLKLGHLKAAGIMRTLQVRAKPTTLARALAEIGRIAKTVHILRTIDGPAFRRRILTQLNHTELRHRLGRRIHHGERGEIRSPLQQLRGSHKCGTTFSQI